MLANSWWRHDGNLLLQPSSNTHTEDAVDTWLADAFCTDLWPQPITSKNKGSPYSITERRVLELIPVLGSQPAGDASHKPDSRLPLLSATPAVTPATLKRAATNFAAWWTGAQWVWTVCLRLLPDSITTAIWTQAFCAWVQHDNYSATEPPSKNTNIN